MAASSRRVTSSMRTRLPVQGLEEDVIRPQAHLSPVTSTAACRTAAEGDLLFEVKSPRLTTFSEADESDASGSVVLLSLPRYGEEWIGPLATWRVTAATPA